MGDKELGRAKGENKSHVSDWFHIRGIHRTSAFKRELCG